MSQAQNALTSIENLGVPSQISTDAVIASISLRTRLFVHSKKAQFDEQYMSLRQILDYSGSYLGAAIYEQSRTTILLLKDVLEDQEYNSLNALLEQEKPTTILANKAQDIRFIRHISELCGVKLPEQDIFLESTVEGSSSISLSNPLDPSAETSTNVDESDTRSEQPGPPPQNAKDDLVEKPKCDIAPDGKKEDGDDEEGEPDRPALIFLANNTFNFETAFKRISELFVEESANEAENHLTTRFRIDMSCRNMVRAMGALLKYMDSARIGVEFEPANVRTPVTAIKTLSIDEMVEIDSNTYLALDIFLPNEHKRAAKAKSECKSLFGLCNKCRSAPGKRMLRKWFEHPTTNREVLSERQEAISYFLQDCNMDLTGKLHTLLGSLRSMRYILNQLRNGSAKVLHWDNLYKTISSSVMIGRYLETMGSPLKLLKDDIGFYGDVLEETYVVLNAMIDFEESYSENRLVMSPGVDPELDEAKRLYRNLPSLLTQVAQDESSRFKAETCSVAYVPMIGYLVALPHDFPVEKFEDVDIIYSTNHTIHAKSERMRTLDEEYGDVKMRIIDKETTITLRMSSLILSRSSLLFGIERAGALLDAAISLALTARQFGWNRPKFVGEPIIDAVRVVHPLSQLVTEHFVPNPISSGGDYSKIKIFTGPNACGKSVYLKQVGVLVFLAHIGSFVPAEVAHVGIVNRILSRIYTIDAALDGLSTFAKDLDQISLALRRGNERSLVIIDEFGKGTMTEVGLSLLASTVSHWAAKGPQGCPHVFVASHFQALPELVNDEFDVISYHTMEVMKKGAELNFQYHLVDGLVDSSYAAYTASKMGVAQDLVDRANKIYEFIRGGHALSDLTSRDTGEDVRNQWLMDAMVEVQPQFEEWDIRADVDSLLEMLEKYIFAPDEKIQQEMSQESNSTNDEHENEEVGVVNDEEDDTDSQMDREGVEQSTVSEDENIMHQEDGTIPDMLPSAMCNKSKSKDRSNLSVSFALDMVETGAGVASTTVTSDSENVEDIKRIVIADSDDETTETDDEEKPASKDSESRAVEEIVLPRNAELKRQQLPSFPEVVQRKRTRSF